MPNINAAFGLRPYRKLGSTVMNHGTNPYKLQTAATAGTSSVIYEGQPVIALTNGMIDVPGAAAGGTVPLLGVFLGCEYTDLTGKPRFTNRWPGTANVKANTPAIAHIYDDPNQLFLINCNAAAADSIIHANANFATILSGSTDTGKSSGVLDVSTVNTTNTLNLRILGFEDSPGNDDATAAGRLAIVKLNVHQLNATTGI